MVYVTATDPAGNTVTKPWRIGIPRIVVVTSPIRRGETERVDGLNFQPGEDVDATMYSAPYPLGVKTADNDGHVTWSYVIAADTELGRHTVELVGPLSGKVEGALVVIAAQTPDAPPPPDLPFTGSNDLVGFTGAAVGAVLAGLLLLLAKRRRREEDEEAPISQTR